MDDPKFEHDAEWFREPNRRERRIAAVLFVGFGLFFVMLFVLHAGWWFRWVILALGIISIVNGLRHWLTQRQREATR